MTSVQHFSHIKWIPCSFGLCIQLASTNYPLFFNNRKGVKLRQVAQDTYQNLGMQQNQVSRRKAPTWITAASGIISLGEMHNVAATNCTMSSSWSGLRVILVTPTPPAFTYSREKLAEPNKMIVGSQTYTLCVRRFYYPLDLWRKYFIGSICYNNNHLHPRSNDTCDHI